MADFKQAFLQTMKFEGGWNLVKGDRGGETYKGIARNFFQNWAGWKIIDTHKPLKNNAIINDLMLDNLVLQFYKTEFWDIVGGDSIEDQPTAKTLFDFGVNAGHGQSIKNLQITLKIPITGKISNELINAVNNPENYLV